MTARQQARQAFHGTSACPARRDTVARRARCRSAVSAVALALAVLIAVPACGVASADAAEPSQVTIEAGQDREPGAVPAVDGWTARSDAPSATAAAAPPVATPAPPLAVEIDDHALFERALGAIEAGRPQDGQRLLEQLVARSPGALIADDARRRLAEIYARAFAATPAAATPSATAAASVPADPGPEAAAPATSASTAAVVKPPVIEDKPAAWRDRARRTHRFEGMLGAEVGDRVFFGVSSSDVGTRARNVLERQARWIVRYPDLYVIVEGHADEPGDEAQNRALSLERAGKARRILIGSGLSADRIDIDARGRQDRVADCDTASCQAQNRRVVTRLMVVLPHGRERSSAADGMAPMAR